MLTPAALKLSDTSESPTEFIKTQIAGPPLTVSDSEVLKNLHFYQVAR